MTWSIHLPLNGDADLSPPIDHFRPRVAAGADGTPPPVITGLDGYQSRPAAKGTGNLVIRCAQLPAAGFLRGRLPHSAAGRSGSRWLPFAPGRKRPRFLRVASHGNSQGAVAIRLSLVPQRLRMRFRKGWPSPLSADQCGSPLVPMAHRRQPPRFTTIVHRAPPRRYFVACLPACLPACLLGRVLSRGSR